MTRLLRKRKKGSAAWPKNANARRRAAKRKSRDALPNAMRRVAMKGVSAATAAAIVTSLAEATIVEAVDDTSRAEVTTDTADLDTTAAAVMTDTARAAVTLAIPGGTSLAVEETLVTIPEIRAEATLGTNLGVTIAIARAETAMSLAEEVVAVAAGRAGKQRDEFLVPYAGCNTPHITTLGLSRSLGIVAIDRGTVLPIFHGRRFLAVLGPRRGRRTLLPRAM